MTGGWESVQEFRSQFYFHVPQVTTQATAAEYAVLAKLSNHMNVLINVYSTELRQYMFYFNKVSL